MTTAQLTLRVAALFIKKRASEVFTDEYGKSRKPGDFWQTSNGNWRAINPDGNRQTFRKQDMAEEYAKGLVRDKEKKYEEDMEGYLQEDFPDFLKEMESLGKEERTIGQKMSSLFKEQKKAWRDFKGALEDSKKYKDSRRKMLDLFGAGTKAVFGAITRLPGIKKIFRTIEDITHPLTGYWVGEKSEVVKEHFKEKFDSLAQSYKRKKQNLSENPNLSDEDRQKKLDQLEGMVEKKYDKLKEAYKKEMDVSLEATKGDQYKMVGKVLGNLFLSMSELGGKEVPEEDKYKLTAYEKKNVGVNLLGRLVAPIAAKVGVTAGLGALMAKIVPGIAVGVGAKIIVGALVFMALHKGARLLHQKITGNSEHQFNKYLDDLTRGATSQSKLEKSIDQKQGKIVKKYETLKDKAKKTFDKGMKEAEDAYKKKSKQYEDLETMSADTRTRMRQKFFEEKQSLQEKLSKEYDKTRDRLDDQMDAEIEEIEVQINEALAGGQMIFQKSAGKVKKYTPGNTDKDFAKATSELLKNSLTMGLKGIQKDIKKDPDGSMKTQVDTIDKLIEGDFNLEDYLSDADKGKKKKKPSKKALLYT